MIGTRSVTQRLKLWLCVALTFLVGVATAMMTEELILRAQGNVLNFSAPQVHYLSGRPLERMKNAEQVRFDFRVTLASKNKLNVVREKTAQFRISYALWEERFKVVEIQPVSKTKANLTASEAEAWCLQEMSGLDLAGIDSNQPLWAHMEIGAQDESSKPVFGKDNITDEGISLTSGLTSAIEVMSPKKRKSAQPWTLESGPVTLEQLRRVK